MGLLKELEYNKMTNADDGSSAWKIFEVGAVPVSFEISCRPETGGSPRRASQERR